MILSCAARDADPGGLGTYFPDLASSRQTRRFSREVLRRSSGTEINRRDSLAQELVRLKSIAQYQHGVTGAPNVFVTAGVANNAYASQDMMTFGKITVWAEYFNNMRKCWEPLLEKMVATVLYEKVHFSVTFYVLCYNFLRSLSIFTLFKVDSSRNWLDHTHSECNSC